MHSYFRRPQRGSLLQSVYKNRHNVFQVFVFVTLILIVHYKFASSPPVLTIGPIGYFTNHSHRESLLMLDQTLPDDDSLYNGTFPECGPVKQLEMAHVLAFHEMSRLLKAFRREIPEYPIDHYQGRGIVLAVGPAQVGFAKVNLKMMELSSSKLPVEVWFDSSELPSARAAELLYIAPRVNITICCFVTGQCQNAEKKWPLDQRHIHVPESDNLRKKFPVKPAAMLSSKFAEVLFLDCDAFITRDPEELFLSDPMYLKFGALFFPDGYRSRQHPAVWTLFNTTCARDEYEFDSSAMLIDKRRVWSALYLTKLINDHSKIFYTHVTDGDKDTFRLAFRYMKINYHLATTPCSTGLYNGTYFCGLTLCKMDSLSKHVYINHVHLFKHDLVPYSEAALGHTRIAFGDPQNNTIYFQHCKLRGASSSCFLILEARRENMTLKENTCYTGDIATETMENHTHIQDRINTLRQLRNNRVLMSKTNDVMPNFVDNFLKFKYLI